MKKLLHILNGVLAVLGRALLCVTILGALCYTAPGLKGLTFWTLVSADVRQEQVVCLITYLALMGAMLFIVANGPGQMSLDAKRR